MNRIFWDVLEINIAVSVVIFILILSAGKLRARYGAAWMKTVWLLLVVRLLIPYNFSMPNVGVHLFNTPEFVQENMLVDTIEGQAGGKADTIEGEAGREKDTIEGQAGGEADTIEGEAGIGAEGNDENDGNGGNGKNSGAGANANANADAAILGENYAAGSMQELGSHTGLNGTDNNITDDSALSDRTEGWNIFFPGVSYAEMLIKFWRLGGIIAFLYLAVSYIVFYRKYQKGIYRIRDKELYQRIAAIQKEQIGRVRIPVYASPSIASPMLIGIFNPKLLLPVNRKEWEFAELELMMAHELGHYKNKDLVLKFVMMVTCCIHWFNPAVYLLKKQFFYEIELACDENVLRERGEREKDLYARMILSFAGSKKQNAAFSTSMWEKKKRMKERLSYILDEHRRKRGVLSIVMMAAAVLLTGFMVSCGYKPDENSSMEAGIPEADENVGNPNAETDNIESINSSNSSNEEVLRTEADFDYNHEYNEMLRCYENDIFLARNDGIYYRKDGEETETLLYANDYGVRRGMELYQNFLFFCGSAQRGEEEAATIYRMNLDTFEVEDALAMFSRTFDILYEVSIYEGNLYVSHQASGRRIGFALDENGMVTGELDEEADDFLYREFNEYVELEWERLNVEFDTEEYWEMAERLNEKYVAVMDVAACKKLLEGNQVVSRYKDEMSRSLYLEKEDGTYEHLCDSVRMEVLITQDGIYYLPNEEGDVWYFDFETRTPRPFFERQTRDLYSVYLLNYDADYIYLLKNRHIGFDADDMAVDENFLLRIPRTGGEAEKVYQFPAGLNLNMPYVLYRHCAVYDGQMFFENLDTIRLNPEEHDMPKSNTELSEDAEKMVQVANLFIEAYLGNDEETLRSLLVGDYNGTLGVYPALPEQAKQINEMNIGGLPEGNIETGVRCFISCELRSSAWAEDMVEYGNDGLAYFNMEIVKTEQGFFVRSYSYESEN